MVGLKFEEAGEKYKEVKREFENVKINYGFFNRKFIKKIKEEDKDTLENYVCVLSLLKSDIRVQERATLHFSNLPELITILQVEIFDYLACFKNGGIKKVGSFDYLKV